MGLILALFLSSAKAAQPSLDESPAVILESRKAAAALGRELRTEPNGPDKAALLAALGSGDRLDAFNAAVRRLSPDAPPTTALKAARTAARLNVLAERWKEAHEFAKRALGLAPNDPEALISHSRAHAGMGDFKRAYKDAREAMLRGTQEAQAYSALAAAEYGLGHYLQALEDSRRALALDANDRTAFQVMKLAQARAQVSARLGLSPNAGSIEREYHVMIQQISQADEHRLSFAPSGSAAPGSARRLAELAGAKLSLRDYRGAILQADQALARDPFDLNALYYRAVAGNILGGYLSAAEDASRGLSIAPSDAALHDARAWAYNHLGRYKDAIIDAQTALEFKPADAYARGNRAYAYEQLGDYPSMIEDYKAAAAANPQFECPYRDALRRHGFEAVTASRGRSARKAKSFTALLVFSLTGGMIVALGVIELRATLAAESRTTGAA